jgi:hypothetical protein
LAYLVHESRRGRGPGLTVVRDLDLGGADHLIS